MHKSLLFLAISMMLISCRTNRVIDGKRVGLWIEHDTIEGSVYTSRGRYKNDFEVGKWRHFKNKTVVKTEKYHDSICLTTHYHANGNVRLQGKTKLQERENELHWFYFGPWNEYDSVGNLLETTVYENGLQVDPD